MVFLLRIGNEVGQAEVSNRKVGADHPHGLHDCESLPRQGSSMLQPIAKFMWEKQTGKAFQTTFKLLGA